MSICNEPNALRYYDNSSNDNLSNGQFIEPTVYRTAVYRSDLSDLTVARHYYGVVIKL